MSNPDTRSALLALDTATEACSAAVVVGDHVVASRFERLHRGHAERLMPMVEAVMAEAGLDYRALSAIVASVGPGSFTGVRVGLAAARGLALAAARPLVGVTTLEALVAAVPRSERTGHRILAALDALRGQVYAQWFDDTGRERSEPMASSAAAITTDFACDGALVVGSGAAAVLAAFEPGWGGMRRSGAPDWPDAATIGRLVASRGAHAGGIQRLAAHSATPLYLREAGAKPLEGAVLPARSP